MIKPDYEWDAIWIAFKLRYCDVVGITYSEPGGMIKFMQKDADDLLPARDSLIGIKMAEFGLQLEEFPKLVAAARRDHGNT